MMQRRTPMKRTAWKPKVPKAKPAKPRKPMARSASVGNPVEQRAKLRARREVKGLSDPAYLDWLHTQGCELARWALAQWRDHRRAVDIGPCSDVIHADHERGGGRDGPGMGQKASDSRSWSICETHHMARHDAAAGFWGSMTKADKTAFIAARIDEQRARYLAELATGGPLGGM